MAESKKQTNQFVEVRWGRSGPEVRIHTRTDDPARDPHFLQQCHRLRRYPFFPSDRERRFPPTVVVVWGYGVPRMHFFAQGAPTPRAELVAAEHGWEAHRAEAWVREIMLPLAVPIAMDALRIAAHRDAAVAGWRAIDEVGRSL